ncbi:MAG: glycosyltransferase family 1 protein [Xylophilus ampelinus]
MNPLLVFSHLRWNFVYQRPQHLLSRLAAHREVIFFEEPVPGADHPWLEHLPAPAGVTVLRPHVTGRRPGFDPEHLHILRQMLRGIRAAHAPRGCLAWFYTPMALPLADALRPAAIVYDCMDELAAFRGAPPQLAQHEAALLRRADLVLTGGRSLHEAKRGRHANVHCFPSSVDAAHFGRARGDHPSQSGLPRPRLGYYGVIDERLDLGLLASLADARPDWQVVMVGPVAKIDPAGLPRRANLHWMGPRDYAELPAHLAGWDVCLMPFALNESTRFISPTKTLEYLAAGRPVVSTRIRDVAEAYSGVVAIADDAAEFVGACARILGWSEAERSAHRRRAWAVLDGNSWDATAARVAELLALLEPGVPADAAADPASDAAEEGPAAVRPWVVPVGAAARPTARASRIAP